VIEDIKILEAVERYISGQMSPDERVYFEQLRKANPEVDQMVVEHTYFLQHLNRFDEGKKFRSTLNDVHTDLSEKGIIHAARLQGKARVVYLFNKFKKTTAIAASIAGITALTISALVWSLSPSSPKNNQIKQEIVELKSQVDDLNEKNNQLAKAIAETKQANIPNPIVYRPGGTGFLVDGKGYLVTNAHVINGAKFVAVQNHEGKEFSVSIVHVDAKRDLAILKINDTAFRAVANLPYSIKHTPADISETIFTLGYPKNDIVYGQGYLAARTGFNGDTLTCQITIAANQGNSGGPVFNNKGEVIGVLSTKQKTAEGVVFAIQSKYIHQAIQDLMKSEPTVIRSPSSSSLKGMDRVQQVKKVSEFVYMVKVN
jgi:S1-C subfamily serine protease